jgi:hypothetical protein
VWTVIGAFVPLSPVVAFLIVIAARRRVNPDPSRAEIWRARWNGGNLPKSISNLV